MSRLSPPKNNYMKYYRVIRYFIKKKYNLTQADLEMLYFLHDEEYFSKVIFKKYNDIMTWDKIDSKINKEGDCKFRNRNCKKSIIPPVIQIGQRGTVSIC